MNSLRCAETHSRLRNASLRVREYKGEIVFLHEVAPGAADRSYGVQVAKAGRTAGRGGASGT
jgi:DNA mismatch repair ATPase MutS